MVRAAGLVRGHPPWVLVPETAVVADFDALLRPHRERHGPQAGLARGPRAGLHRVCAPGPNASSRSIANWHFSSFLLGAGTSGTFLCAASAAAQKPFRPKRPTPCVAAYESRSPAPSGAKRNTQHATRYPLGSRGNAGASVRRARRWRPARGAPRPNRHKPMIHAWGPLINKGGGGVVELADTPA